MIFVKVSVFVLIFCVNVFSTQAADCITPRNTYGDCKPIYDCPVISAALERETNSDLLIESYKCGYNKVCCEEYAYPCVTPENKPGACVFVSDCEYYQKQLLLQINIKEVLKAQCSRSEYFEVCCPLLNDLKESNLNTPETPTRFKNDVLPKPGKCGIQLDDYRIIGGRTTSIYEFPWIVLLEYGSYTKPTLVCGGSLISSRFVLSAAHCVNGRNVHVLGQLQRVRLGEYNLSTDEDCVEVYTDINDCTLPLQRIDVEKVLPHPGFIPTNNDKTNDIALIKLKQEAKFTDFVRPICLPTPDEQLPTTFLVAGWGETDKSYRSDVKLKVKVPLHSKETCNSFYSRIRNGPNLGSSQLCAWAPGMDNCNGDSGGPLMNQTGEIWYLYGVVSFGAKVCGQNQPSVYTNVLDYLPWIYENVD